MKWRRKNRAAETETVVKKNASTHSSTPLFQLSNAFFPFSWISRMKREKQSGLKQISPPANPERVHADASADRLCFEVDHAPRRKSTGDNDIRHKIAIGRERLEISRSARHFSQSEHELHPISRYRSWDLDSPPTPIKRADVRQRGQRMRPKVKVRSPRAARTVGVEMRSLESFATAKMSIDPQKDFRESMMDMIREKRMRRPGEMESLLACYISLNADEHHDFILKAFWQVLFDLKPRWLTGGRFGCCHCRDR